MPPRRVNLENIREDIGGLKEQMKAVVSSTDKAETSNKEVHEKLEKLAIEMVRVNNSVKVVTTEVADMKPVVTDYQKLRQNINGGLIVLAGIGAAIFTAIGFVLKDIMAWIVAHVRVG